MNPYDFVRIDWDRGVERRSPPSHDRFSVGLSGRLDGTITTLTPLFIPRTEDLKRRGALQQSNRPLAFARNGLDQHVIPGSSLKGLFRSLVETLGPGCWWLYDGQYGQRQDRVDYSDKLPASFRQCPRNEGVCIACRIFGLIKGSTLFLGHVGFEDAVCAAPTPHDPIFTPILDAPKPRHSAWYLDGNNNGNRVAGRKFFFHAAGIGTEAKLLASRLNQYIHPVGSGSIFSFAAHFDGVDPQDWPVLLYALALERKDWGHDHDVRHKIGYAKPAGLGSIEVRLSRLTLVDYRKRYGTADRGQTTYEGATLRDYVNAQIRERFLNARTPTLADLRRIWAWPPAPGVSYRYPTREWFANNRTAPISSTR